MRGRRETFCARAEGDGRSMTVQIQKVCASQGEWSMRPYLENAHLILRDASLRYKRGGKRDSDLAPHPAFRSPSPGGGGPEKKGNNSLLPGERGELRIGG